MGSTHSPSRYKRGMADFGYLVLAIVFFALCVAYIRGLDRFVRASEEVERAAEQKTR